MEYGRETILLKLIGENHISVPERRSLSPNPTFIEILQTAERYFSQNKFLPKYVTSWAPDVFSYDGCCIEKTSLKEYPYILRIQEVGATMNVIRSNSHECGGLKEALIYYLRQHRFNIDGIDIVQNY